MPAPRSRGSAHRTNSSVVSIESTKSAKARYRRSGGQQWTPTKGEINAAEIWNKQEEKIRKARDREEKKRKDATRQAEKDALLKEQQQEMLRKGRITIEDTWGKVTASQNRLHKFFGQPKTHPLEGDFSKDGAATGVGGEVKVMKLEPFNEARILQSNTLSPSLPEKSHETSSAQNSQVIRLTSESVLPQGSENLTARHSSVQDPVINKSVATKSLKRKRTTPTPSTPPAVLMESPTDHGVQEDNLSKPPSQPLSQVDEDHLMKSSSHLMPPPPKPVAPDVDLPGSSSHRITNPRRLGELLHTYADPASPTHSSRSPLSEMTSSQLNVRAKKQQDCGDVPRRNSIDCESHSADPMSTQVFKDTIWGLSSQDFVDDLDQDDKENLSPLLGIPKIMDQDDVNKSKVFQPTHAACTFEGDEFGVSDTRSPGFFSTDTHEDSLETDHDDFDDFDVDDETLLSLAATQRLKKDPCRAAQYGHESLDLMGLQTNLDATIHQTSSPGLFPGQVPVSDSFTFSNVDESDLLQCICDFEDDEQQQDADIENAGDEDEDLADALMLSVVEQFEEAQHVSPSPPRTKRTSLPWVRYPFNADEGRTETSLSQITEILEG